MTGNLTFYFHPLSNYCQKALIALYECEAPFEPLIVDLGNAESRARLTRIWPIGKFPVLRDEAADLTIPEATIIIEYLAQRYPGRTPLVPTDPDLARETRLRDRFFDLYVGDPMAKIVTDKLRPEGKHDPHGVEQAKALLTTAYGVIDQTMAARTWAAGNEFTMADCSAGPNLFYAEKVIPFGDGHKNLTAYFARLSARPSFVRVLEEARPYFAMFPG